jgi:hypothetical protein
MADHTTEDTNLPFLDECPICLDNYSLETCLRITGIDGCNHHIGRKCLEEMLRSRPNEEKKCPLCRAVWIPARPRFPSRGQSLATSRRMQGMFDGLDGIGENIAGTQLGIALGEPVLHPRHQRHIAETQLGAQTRREGDAVPAARPRVAAPSPIAIDSDSDEEDYETQYQNFQNATREIADIRNRAQLQPRRNRGTVTNESSSNSDNAPSRPKSTLRSTAAGRDALNRFMNPRALNPFRPTQQQEPRREGAQDVASRRLERARDEQRRIAPLRARRQPSRHSDASTSSPSPSPPLEILSPPPRRNIEPANHDADVCMDDEVQEVPQIASQSARQLNQRELDLDRREQAVAAREARMARQEVDVRGSERLAREMVEMVRRQREEVDELMRRHREELERTLR